MEPIYADESDVLPLIKYIKNDADSDLIERVLLNADDIINSRLIEHSLPIFTNENNASIPSLLNTAAVYYSVSDILLSLYNGEDLPVSYDTYYNKAESMLNSYITQMEFELSQTELKNKNVVSYRKSPTYYQRKHRHRQM